MYEVILQEYHKDAEEVQRWRLSYLELMMKKRTARIRKENGEEEEDQIESMDDLRESSRQRELAQKKKSK